MPTTSISKMFNFDTIYDTVYICREQSNTLTKSWLHLILLEFSESHFSLRERRSCLLCLLVTLVAFQRQLLLETHKQLQLKPFH